MTDGEPAAGRRQRLLIASGNPGKIREFAQILDSDVWEVVAPAEAGVSALVVPEDALTYRENAARKARAYANASGMAVLADDSGLEVDALGGAPGIRSARYAEGESDGSVSGDEANRAKLLRGLAGVPAAQRSARFRAVVALSFPYGPDVWYGEGTVEGRIAQDERGSNGFGYDPLFELPDGRRMAELSPLEKSRISHRARALQDAGWALAAVLKALARSSGDREEEGRGG